MGQATGPSASLSLAWPLQEDAISSATEPAGTSAPLAEAETALVSAAASGDERAFEEIMRLHNQLLYRTARSILKNDADAEDAVQDAFLRAWRALGSFRAESKLSTWLVRIVTNEALGRLRRARVRTLTLEDVMTSPDPKVQAALADAPERGPEQVALRAQLRKAVEERIDELPDAYRTVFMLRAVEEMTPREVAEALGIPQATVRTRFFRARNLLRGTLAGEVDADLSSAFAFDGARCDRIVEAVLRRVRELAAGERRM